MILTTVKLFNELMAFLDGNERIGFTKANLKEWLDQRAIALSPPSLEDITAEELDLLGLELDELATKLQDEIKPYLLFALKKEIGNFIDVVLG